jgi:hypothetical protein
MSKMSSIIYNHQDKRLKIIITGEGEKYYFDEESKINFEMFLYQSEGVVRNNLQLAFQKKFHT